MQEKIAEPTIGRVVYVYNLRDPEPRKPFAAIVADVTADGMSINCGALGHDGRGSSLQNVPHISMSDMLGNPVAWDWMPYQKGQAAKTEALQAELDKKTGKG